MRNNVFKYSLLISISMFVLGVSPYIVLAVNYGDGLYGADLYSSSIPLVNTVNTNIIQTTGITKKYRDNFLAEQKTKELNLKSNIITSNTSPTVTTSNILKISSNRVLIQEMKGNDVKQLQVYLNTHGYVVSITGTGSVGNETTYFGLKTKQAIMNFQKANNLTPDGIVGPKTLALMNLSTLNSPNTSPATISSTSSNTTVSSRSLRQGIKGEDVKAIQEYLNKNGYSIGVIDGIFGPKTKSAVVLFQDANNLITDGIVGPKTLGVMR